MNEDLIHKHMQAILEDVELSKNKTTFNFVDTSIEEKLSHQALAKAMGAKITGMDFLRGSYDFIATIEAENFEDLAAVKLTFEATRAGKMTILESVDINKIAKKAGTAMANYVPPASN